jgi:hypothetical protein
LGSGAVAGDGQVFGIDYTTIASIVDRSPAHCRKIAPRVREHVGDRNRRLSTSRGEQEAFVETFVQAVEDSDTERLGTLLANDAVSYSDGGGKVTAALRPIYGRDRITRFLMGLAGKALPDVRLDVWPSMRIPVLPSITETNCRASGFFAAKMGKSTASSPSSIPQSSGTSD